MAHTFRSHDPYQCYLLPPSSSDWLDKDHKAYFVRDLVGSLDMSAFLSAYSKDGRGAPAFSPALLLSIVLYGWLRGVYSCRKLAQLCRDDIGARSLVGEEQPDFRSLNRFRLRHSAALEGLFLQSVRLCKQAGLVTLTDVAVDGTRMASYASKHKNIHYGKIAAEEERHLAFVRGAMARADEEDAAEDALYGEGNAAAPVDERMKSREGRLALLGEAKAALEAEAKQQAQEKRKHWDEADPSEPPHTKRPDPDTAAPSKTAQYSPADPDSRVQYSCQSGFLQGYNAQIAVDADSQVIVACDLSSCATDVWFLRPMLDQAQSNTAVMPERVLADAGYYSARNVLDMESRGLLALVPPPLKKSERQSQPPTELDEAGIAALTPKQLMRYRLAQSRMKEIFGKRRKSVEPVFGQIKGSPGNSRYGRFLRRTLEKCRLDWTLLCGIHNLGKLRAANLRQAAV